MTLLVLLIFLMILFFIARMNVALAFVTGFFFLLLFYSGTFIVNEGSQVVITQFGRIIGSPYTEAGLYFKIPFIWKANYFDKRIFNEEDLQADVTTKDFYNISVDTVINWRISDAAIFFKNMPSLTRAHQILKNIVSGSVREIIAAHNMIDSIRGDTISSDTSPPSPLNISPLVSIIEPKIGIDNEIYIGRAQIQALIKRQNYNYSKQYGIEIVAVLIRNINYGHIMEKSINDRMVTNKLVEAAQLRSEGLRKYNIMTGYIEEKYQSIIAPAKKEAEVIKGGADATATKIYAQSYGDNADFYNFWRTLSAYEVGIPPKSQGAVLSTQNQFLKLLNGQYK